MSRSRGLTAAGLGLAVAAGAVSAGGAMARRATLQRQRLDGIDGAEVGAAHPFDWIPDAILAVTTDDGLSLHVEVDEPVGSETGPTVVFAHGYCLALGCWIHQRRALVEAGYRVVCYDQRGHGQSAHGDIANDTIDQLGRDLHAVIAATTPTSPLVLVGHSMGGMTVMALADQHPMVIHERVIAAAFLATTAGGDGLITTGFGRHLGAAVLRNGPGVLAHIAARQGVWRRARILGRDLESALVDRFSFGSPVSQETVRYAADMLLGTDLTVVAAFLPTLESHDKQAALAAFAGIDTLVINGEEDRLTPPEHSQAIVDALQGCEHVVITDAGHLVMLEHPALVNANLLALIDRALVDHPAVTGQRKRKVTDIARRRAVAKARGSRTPRASRARAAAR